MSDVMDERPRSAAVTKRDLVEGNFGALDQQRVGNVAVSNETGGIRFASALEVMDFAKLMAMADKAVPPDFRGNAGMCLAVTMQAVEWRMSPFQVANKAYVVNDRLAFESQLLHAVIEARAPLKERLDCTYSGEGPTRKVKIIGKFLDGTVREYESPELLKIKKKSPLWTDDPDQQLFYYGSRSWARKWCPDVLLGIYSREEVQENPHIGQEEPRTSGLHARLVNGNVSRDEGHKEGQTEQELKTVNGKSEDKAAGPAQAAAEPEHAEHEEATEGFSPDSALDVAGFSDKTIAVLKQHGIESLAGVLVLTETELKGMKGVAKAMVGHIKTTVEKHGFALRSEEKTAAEAAEQEMTEPHNVKEWEVYCRAWIDKAKRERWTPADIRKRWNDERALRNNCGLTSEERDPVQQVMVAICKELGE